MTRCSYEIVHDVHGPLQCAAPSLERAWRCAQHAGRGARAPERADEPELVLDDGCLVWSALAAYHEARRGRRAAELFSEQRARPLAWLPSLGLWVDLVGWPFLERYGRVRPAGTFQRCGRAGCVEPDHAVEPRRRVDLRRIDVSGPLDRHFRMGAA